MAASHWFLLLVVLFCISRVTAEIDKEFVEKLKSAQVIINQSMVSILQEWSVELYPNFLKSASTSKHSFDVMKHKFMDRVMSSAKTRGKWVVSFTGSSVTAGHDSPFAASYPEQVGLMMKSAFNSLNIDFQSRNVALGNNPCVPYDLCPGKFAGHDADMVGWEQSYFCFGGAIIEQFVRQSVALPSKPIVFFSESNTGHWDKEKCKKSPHIVKSHEKLLFAANPVLVMTEFNRDEANRAFGYLQQYEGKYPMVRVHIFCFNVRFRLHLSPKLRRSFTH
jgi:hypothetical protein